MSDEPFRVLGLPAEVALTDDDVRAAWRRIAAATHPDRDDGGDPARYSSAAAAYAALRTSYSRGEALADLASVRGGGAGGAGGRRGRGRGRLGVLAVRFVTAATVSAVAIAFAGWAPASIGVLVGALTWLAATGRHDLPTRPDH